MSTPENIRHHAAGHLAAAILLIDAGNSALVRPILHVISAYLDHPKVIAPNAMRDMIAQAIKDPSNSKGALQKLEQWFCDPFNTRIEESENSRSAA